jgi:hypothetical protein
MHQKMPAGDSFKGYRKKTCTEQFLAEMESVIVWKDLAVVLGRFYPKPAGFDRWGERGCCGFISCSTGSISWTRRPTIGKRPFCGVLV